jgi:predicted MPP superfamily phosphohydrolase
LGLVGLEAGLMIAAGLGIFAAILQLFLGVMAVLLAVCVSTLLLRLRRRASNAAAVCAALMLVPIVAGAHATIVAPYQLVVERPELRLPNIPADGPIRIAIIAELQTDSAGAYEHAVIDRALAEKPDLIVLPGDIFQGSSSQLDREYAGMQELLSRLQAPHGVFACLGNVDDPKRVTSLLRDAGITVLTNEVSSIDVRGAAVLIGGVEWNLSSPAAALTFRAMARPSAQVRLLLCHTPDGAFLARPADRIDLIISGHTHGGQVVIPGWGPPLALTNVPRAVAAGGLHKINQQQLYVSRGAGFERGVAPPLRFCCPPELTVLTLRSE